MSTHRAIAWPALVLLTPLSVLLDGRPIWANMLSWTPGLVLWTVGLGLAACGASAFVARQVHHARILLALSWLSTGAFAALVYFGSLGWYQITAALIVVSRAGDRAGRMSSPAIVVAAIAWLMTALILLSVQPAASGARAPDLGPLPYFAWVALIGLLGLAAVGLALRNPFQAQRRGVDAGKDPGPAA
ncbi:MAG TPA: hypothetical protein VFK38_04140 [Candidatus Limnocylindrales bacterium]|nr:hypothetical protein [Candidatus Limnocylindrales bacterium]